MDLSSNPQEISPNPVEQTPTWEPTSQAPKATEPVRGAASRVRTTGRSTASAASSKRRGRPATDVKHVMFKGIGFALTDDEAKVVDDARAIISAQFPPGLFPAGELIPKMRFLRLALMEYSRSLIASHTRPQALSDAQGRR